MTKRPPSRKVKRPRMAKPADTPRGSAKLDREHRDDWFEQWFALQPNRGVIKRPVIPGERSMRDPPEPWLIIAPEFPQGISRREWESLDENKQTNVARFWYMSNYQPDTIIGPDDGGRDRSSAFSSGIDTSDYTNMTEYINTMFGPMSLALVGVNVEETLHPISRAWVRAPRLEIHTEDEQLLREIQRAAVGIKREYAEVERRSNLPADQALRIPEMKDLLRRVEDIVAASESGDREAAEKKLGGLSTIIRSFAKGLAESAGKRVEGVITPYVMVHAIPLYHRLVDFIHYVGQFIGYSPFQ